MERKYKVTALQMTIWYNKEGDHDHNGMLYALRDNVPILKYLRALSTEDSKDPARKYKKDAEERAAILQVDLPNDKIEAETR